MPSTPTRPDPRQQVEPVRLQKVLADAGVGSRRSCEQLIAAGRVSVDGHTIRELGTRVDPARAVIRVDGARVDSNPGLVYLAVNKPAGVVSTMRDEQGRPSLGDIVRDRPQRLFHVGRLDAASEGLILLTNDGALAHRLSHPSFGVAKTYLAEVRGPLPRDLGARLRGGVPLDGRPVPVSRFRVVGRVPGRVQLELDVHEGRQHVVRRLLAELGHPVLRLVRTAVGPIRLGQLRPGQVRRLTTSEVSSLYQSVDL